MIILKSANLNCIFSLAKGFKRMSNLARENILVLFDVDGTLTPARKEIQPDFEEFLYTKIKPIATIGIVGGSDLEKMKEQLNGKRIMEEFDYVFPENGLVQIEKGVEVGKVSIQKHLGEEILQDFLNFALKYLSEIKLPVKRGNFIDFRNGMINVCPIGRQCTYDERLAFNKYDEENLVRVKMIEAFKKRFENVDLTYSIGGQISVDVFPHGWDKTFCLRHATKGTNYKEIHFFGDKTEVGGNDYEIFSDPRTIGHKVTSPEDTRKQLEELFKLN